MPRPRKPLAGSPDASSVIYDTGALICAERRNSAMWSFHDEALAAGVTPIVPVEVLAQAWRGGPQVDLSRLLCGCWIEPTSESTARQAGRACALAGTSDIVDAVVVVCAVAHNALVVTGDPADLIKVAEAIDAQLRVHVV